MVETFLVGITILPLTSEEAREYAKVCAALEKAGTPIGPFDLMIGSHALALGATLVSNNVGEFRRIPGLRCEDWT